MCFGCTTVAVVNGKGFLYWLKTGSKLHGVGDGGGCGGVGGGDKRKQKHEKKNNKIYLF